MVMVVVVVVPDKSEYVIALVGKLSTIKVKDEIKSSEKKVYSN